MDTKLKSISYTFILKVVAFLMIAIALTTAVIQLQYLDVSDFELETIVTEKYSESIKFLKGDARSAIYDVSNTISGSKDTLGQGYYYYFTDGDKFDTNLTSSAETFLDQYKGALFTLKDSTWLYKNDVNYPYYYHYVDVNVSGFIAFTPEYLANAQKNWDIQRAKTVPMAWMFAGIVIGTLILLIYLTVTIGRTHKNGPLVLNAIDKIPSDLFLVLYMTCGVLWVAGMNDFYSYRDYLATSMSLSMIAVGTISFIFIAITGFAYLSFVRRIKAKSLLTNSITYKFFFCIYDFFRSIFDGRMFRSNKLTNQLFKRQAAFILMSFVLVLMTFVFMLVPPLVLLPPLAEIFIIYWYVKGNKKTFEAIDRGFNDSLEDQMKAERMKIQLVTNVSHDLKTPLTSIISYADLLSKDETLTETSRDYVSILIDKSNRLKNIVSDLFDLAKSTSGDIQLELEAIDIKKLIEQTLADMGDEIEKSTLQFKVKLPESPVIIMADGKKMYRVFQNLIDNALKYALQGTRVFIDLESVHQKAIVSIKNTAGYEMDFTAEEILQRFSRGDASRTTEGNGLGLSIAESFTQVCGGKFLLNVDGDLFKVTLQFNEINSETI